MELLNNSVWVDARLFPKVDRPTILDATPFFQARLRSSFVEGQTLRLDTAFISWDGESVLGKIPQLLMALIIKQRPGLTLLRQYLGSEIQNFTHVVLDPAQPHVVTLVGPRALPKGLPEGLEMVNVTDALAPANFDLLHATTKVLIGMLKYIQFKDPAEVGEVRMGLNNGHAIQCVTTDTTNPVFTLEPMQDGDVPAPAEPEPAPVGESAVNDEPSELDEVQLHQQQHDAIVNGVSDDEGAGDNSYSLPA